MPGSRRADAGFATVSFVAAVAASLVLFVTVANLLVFAYARGAVLTSLDEAARAGVRAADPVGECRRRAEAALDDLLGGALRGALQPVRCHVSGRGLHADVEGRLPAWAPGVPDWPVSASATATLRSDEPDP